MKKILITERLKQMVEKGEGIPAGRNFRIFSAASGEEIIDIHRKENLDLIMTDLDLPGINGDEASSIIRNDNSLKEVSIFIVCDDNKSSVSRCHTCSANAYTTRPINYEEVKRNIRKLLYIAKRKAFRVILHALIKG